MFEPIANWAGAGAKMIDGGAGESLSLATGAGSQLLLLSLLPLLLLLLVQLQEIYGSRMSQAPARRKPGP